MSGARPREGSPAAAPASIPWLAMGILFAAHFVVDSQVSFLASLLPLLREKFRIPLGTAGVLVTLLSFSNALAQPITAVVVDRWPRAPWLPLGLVGSAFFLTSVGWLPSFGLIAAALPLGGCLAGLCHPDMASRAGALTERHRGLSLSLFVAGGRLGFATGPLVAIGVAEWWGMAWLWTYTLIALASALAVKWGMPDPGRHAASGGMGFARGLLESVREVRGPLFTLIAVTLLRAIVNVNLMGFLPTLYVESGLGLWSGGAANAILLLFGGAGVMLGGMLADRFGRRNTITAGILLAFVSVTGFLAAPPKLGLAILAVVGIGMYLPMGVNVALAQEFLPRHRGFASALTLGVAWGLASLSVLPISKFAETAGLIRAFWALPLFLVLAALLALRLPEGRPRAE